MRTGRPRKYVTSAAIREAATLRQRALRAQRRKPKPQITRSSATFHQVILAVKPHIPGSIVRQFPISTKKVAA